MKQVKVKTYRFLTLVGLLFLCMFNKVTAQTDDSIRVSLLTCYPSDKEVYTLYGHTAIRYHDMAAKKDWVFNYGVFNFRKPFFTLRFLFGLTDYELGVLPYDIFIKEYQRQQRGIVEQTLNMTTEEKLQLWYALLKNYRPEEREYRYNVFYNNCTTQARDIIERCIQGSVDYHSKRQANLSFREMTHQCTEAQQWETMSIDLCLGLSADFNTNVREQQFLPMNLMEDFDGATISSGDDIRPLVSGKRHLLSPLAAASSAPNRMLRLPSPSAVFGVLLLLSIAITYSEHKRHRTYRVYDAFLFTSIAIVGVVMFALFLSQHPTTSTNLQLLLFCPVILFFLPSIYKGKSTSFWTIETFLLIFFLFGRFFQHYAEGMCFLALSLLSRCWSHRNEIYLKRRNLK